jgi:eukaryotic-like serine/threonine-protein kinase
VPKVVGLKLPKAKRAIAKAGCRTGRVRKARSKKQAGIVISQRPKAKASVSKGTAVSLVVSNGRRPNS